MEIDGDAIITADSRHKRAKEISVLLMGGSLPKDIVEGLAKQVLGHDRINGLLFKQLYRNTVWEL